MRRVFAAVVLLAQFAVAQRVPVVTTVAGGFVNDGQPATAAALNSPAYAVEDSKGNLYISDSINNRIRKVNTKGVISTIAGTWLSAGYSGDGGPARLAMLNDPLGIVVDDKGNVFFSDSVNNRVRKIDTKGIITTIAGNGTGAWSGDNGPATAAGVGFPWGLTLDSAGNLYISQISGNVVRKVDSSGIIHTVAGDGISGMGGMGDGGPATSASLDFPESIVLDSAGNLYIADIYENRVRRVDMASTITTFAGNGDYYCHGDGGAANLAGLAFPAGLVINNGQLLISASCNDTIRAIDLNTNVINAVTDSNFGFGFNGDGLPPLSTEFLNPQGLTTDGSGNLVIVDSGNARVRKIASGAVQTIAGGYLGDGGPGAKSSLNVPQGIAFDPAGNLYIADNQNNRVRRVTTAGIITTFAGNGFAGSSGDGGPAISAALTPLAIATDLNGNVFVASFGSVHRVDPNGTLTKLNQASYANALSTDSLGDVYTSANPLVWKITPSGTATIVAGVANQYGYNGDGIPANQAFLNAPGGTAMDASGNFYIADGGNNRIRKVDINGMISTVAGNGTYGFSGDGGLATDAELAGPVSIALDAKGNLYIADTNNLRIRVVNSSGIIQTFAGTGNFGYNGNYLHANQTNMFPVAVAVSPKGVVYFVDRNSDRVRKIQ